MCMRMCGCTHIKTCTQDTGRQAGGHRQASSQTSRQTYWQAGGRLAGRDRQTGRQTQAGKQSNTGGQTVRLASKQTYWQTFTHAHGDVDKHWGYSAYPLLSLDVCWQQSKSISTCHKNPAKTYVPLQGKCLTLRHFEPASIYPKWYTQPL